jgi:hypothetical protein
VVSCLHGWNTAQHGRLIIPQRPSGDAQAEVKEDANPWSDNESDEEEDGGDSDDDSDGENTVI